jgi:hypothetical protein
MKTLLRLCASTAWAVMMSATSFAQHYTQTNLVSNMSGVAPVTDPQLINPWGLSRGSGSPWWVSDQATGFSTLYNGAGAKQGLVVTIPPADPANKNTPTGTPTGTIFNGSQTDFLLAPGQPAVFLFSTIDGAIVAWNPAVGLPQGAAPPSTNAVVVVKTNDGSSYTGLTSASIDGKRYLYAANFTLGRVDVYDSTFQGVARSKKHSGGNFNNNDDNQGPFSGNSFVDQTLPAHYVPFNVQAIGNDNDKHELQNFRTLVEECMAWNGLVGVPEDLVHQKANLIITGAAGGKRSTIRNMDPFKLCTDGITPEEGAIKYQKDFLPILRWLALDPEPGNDTQAQIGLQAWPFLWEHGDEMFHFIWQSTKTERGRSIPLRLRSTGLWQVLFAGLFLTG